MDNLFRRKLGLFPGVVAGLLFFALPSACHADQDVLLVGISPCPPFVIMNDNHAPEGFSIDLWQAIAEELDLNYKYIYSTALAGKLDDVVKGRVHAAIGGISVTEEREKIVDFTYAYYHTGLGILVNAKRKWSVGKLFASFFSHSKLVVLISFIVFIVCAGHIVWLVERRNSSEKKSFNRNYFPGIVEGMYWAIVTASTVGYGDRVPRSWLGRLLTILLIIITLPLFAFFIAELSSDITLHELRTAINGPQDLFEKKVGVVDGTTSQQYVRKINAVVNSFDMIETAYLWLAADRLDAIVFDRPNLLYYARNAGKGSVKVVGKPFSPQDYAIAVPQDSPLRERLNRVLLSMIENGKFDEIRASWFGADL